MELNYSLAAHLERGIVQNGLLIGDVKAFEKRQPNIYTYGRLKHKCWVYNYKSAIAYMMLAAAHHENMLNKQ